MELERLTREKKLTDTERQVLQYLLEHLDTALAQGVRDIARQNYTSSSTIMRLAHKLGYGGFVDMCYKLSTLTQENTRLDGEAQQFLDSFCANALLNYNTYTQLKTCAEHLARLDRDFLFIYATGFSAMAGNYMAGKLTNMGRRCLFASGQDSSGFFENNLDAMGMFLCISKSGETPLVRDKIRTAHENGIYTVAITGEQENSVSRYADLWFRVEDDCKLDTQNVMPNTFFPQVIMLVELIAYEYRRRCLTGAENGKKL